MNFTPEQLVKAKAAKSVEELLALAKENNIELTEEEAAKYFSELHKEGELADEELENVSGGGCKSNVYISDTRHSHCENYVHWSNGSTYSQIDFSVGCYVCKYLKFDDNHEPYCNDYAKTTYIQTK